MCNFKYIVYVTSMLCSSKANRVDGGCHIGEGRWERNVLDAFIKSGRDTYVIGLDTVWTSGVPIPHNLHDYSEIDDLTSTIFFNFNPPMRLDIPVEAQYYILNWFNGPDDDWQRRAALSLPRDRATGELPDAAKDFREFASKNPNNVIATFNFASRARQYEEAFGKENTYLVQGPSVPEVFRGSNNFDKKYLLWGSKSLYGWSEDVAMHPFLQDVFRWCSSVLLKDEDLKIRFLLGTAGPLRTMEEVADWFWKLPFASVLMPYKNRIEFLYSLEWFEVFDVLKETKLIISPHLGYGGPPFEASSFGIPLILTSNGHPFLGSRGELLFKEVLSVNEHFSGTAFCGLLDKLFYDRSFYEKTGNAYLEYVDKYATYAGYLRQIDSICEARGWK